MNANSIRRVHRALAALVLGLASWGTQAQLTDISLAPLLVAAPTGLQANLMFLLDDSGSMAFDFLPDTVNSGLCRSAGATATSSGSFTQQCCQGGNISSTCWSGAPPFTLRGHPPFLAAGFNGLAYNPNVQYLPPVSAAGVVYNSMTSSNTSGWTVVPVDAFGTESTYNINLLTQYPDSEWCASTNPSYTNCLRNNNYVLPGTVNGTAYTVYHAQVATGTGSVAAGSPDNPTVTTNYSFGPHYYQINAGEYCQNNDLRVCTVASSATTGYTYPAQLRWCNSSANATALSPAPYTCQATQTSTFSYARYPTKYFSAGVAAIAAVTAQPSTVSISMAMSGCSSTKTAGVGDITVNGTSLFQGTATALESSSSNLASDIIARVNAKTSITGFTASAISGNSSGVLLSTAANVTAKPTLSRATGSNSSCTFTPTTASAMSGYVAAVTAVPAVPSSYPGTFQRVDIIPSRTTYPKAAARADCVTTAGVCTYAEEMTNFANWWAYYHTRMQMMKSSATRAFQPLGSNFRVGYMSINNNTGSDYLNINTFADVTGLQQKTNWYAKILAAKPGNSTPLRTALSTVGRIYGGKLNGTTLNRSTVTDPMLYSCQQNFTLLSTDGYWNETNNPVQLDGSTAIGDQDSGSTVPRPYLDGTKTANTLADVAYYYYNTDLRTGTTGSAACMGGTSAQVTTPQDVCGNSTSSTTPNSVQNMGLFTLGLGTSGNMLFTPDYLTSSIGDYYAVAQGLTANPGAGICSWQSSGACNWPVPVSNTLTAVDDLWHAAVNGHGTYVSAGNPTALYTGLSNALIAATAQTRDGSAATASNPNVTATSNQVFVSNFVSVDWTGELASEQININTGVVDNNPADWAWDSQALLDANTNRTIYMYSSSNTTTHLASFSWVNMSTAQQAYFSTPYITSAASVGARVLSQFCTSGPYCVPASGGSINQANAVAATPGTPGGQPLIDYLRGSHANEGASTDPTTYFRARKHVLGDIVSSEAVYVAGPAMGYTDAGYASFASTNANRTPMVYVGANDGMLHAFNATTGVELWAYVPTLMLPKMFELADKAYGSQHDYFVDGTPAVQDVYDTSTSAWRTILVGGFGAGGRGYYALDVTNPAAPIALWEYSDTNLGLTLGKAEIGKTRDGVWSVFFGSGDNNVSPGDGVGRLYVLNAVSGSLIRTISTGVGTTTTPSGMSPIRAWVDNGTVDNTVQRVYAGDVLGNVWRFDVNNIYSPSGTSYGALQLATLYAVYPSTGTTPAQPITARPELGQVGNYAMVFVGTGRYLGQSDLSNSNQQSIYAIKDSLTTTGWGNPRNPADSFVQQTLVSGGTCPANSSACTGNIGVRTMPNPQAVNLAVNGGWYVDLPAAQERVNTDPVLALGTLTVNSNVIAAGSNICQVGGSSYTNYFNYATGAPVSGANGVVSVFLGNALATRPTVVELPNGQVINITRMSDGTQGGGPEPISSATSATQRMSWRDLIQH